MDRTSNEQFGFRFSIPKHVFGRFETSNRLRSLRAKELAGGQLLRFGFNRARIHSGGLRASAVLFCA